MNMADLSRRDWPESAGTIGRYPLRIERFLSVALAALLSIESARAQEVRPYPDPGYRRLGVYGGGPKSYFDHPAMPTGRTSEAPPCSRSPHAAGNLSGKPAPKGCTEVRYDSRSPGRNLTACKHLTSAFCCTAAAASNTVRRHARRLNA